MVGLFVPVTLPVTRASEESRAGRPVRVMPVGELLNLAEMATKGHVGLQGAHGGIPVHYRNIKIKSIE